MVMVFGISPNSSKSIDDGLNLRLRSSNLYTKYMSLPEPSFRIVGVPELVIGEAWDEGEEGLLKKKKKKGALKLRIKIGNPSLRRLICGAIAGAVTTLSVAHLETIRTHLIVGNFGHSMAEVFHNIMNTEGWTGLYRGNLVNVIRFAPSKAIELFAFDTVKKHLTPKPGEQPKLPIPVSPIAGAIAGMSSTLCTYPLELLKTRLTVQVYRIALGFHIFTALTMKLWLVIYGYRVFAEGCLQESSRRFSESSARRGTCRTLQRPYPQYNWSNPICRH
ncbi:unnamed protein product [Ilex paraguariensis]|uniref:Uncharacterized protein n=1 Tax=Ilex paraguariensis TaxID=185542 RepID=A0ABC8RRE4_9AQUA